MIDTGGFNYSGLIEDVGATGDIPPQRDMSAYRNAFDVMFLFYTHTRLRTHSALLAHTYSHPHTSLIEYVGATGDIPPQRDMSAYRNAFDVMFLILHIHTRLRTHSAC